ncbi:hypothetical protein MUK71_08665 [Arthrobacter zhangbolii]|uniref:LppX_LprAFG lipoprotein n=1 Tax=Arthrobacter zhangbolii TaxID=2886936 RepID=A0A9X1M4Y0_9MICC|nr:hypothetical protein [Arthrobacter zhangbolii]MCC3271508.1 hypothetical protein [Arthrobacter zhangbolii]MCC3293417.1 hypothetical protein [Arthrobacter zhangbolii]UON90723.1 hypothetical protein MUK71_08665 [Arthrobacter zhangbolii]
MESRAIASPGLALALAAALLLPLSACGPTADQLRAREESASATPLQPRTAAPRPTETPVPTPVQPTPTTPARVGVTGSQAGMPAPVQDACQWLLRRDTAPMPAAEAGECLSAAMAAGGGAVQTLETETSWLPAGTYTVAFATTPEFALELNNEELDVHVSIREGRRELRQAGSAVSANPDGTAEEAYAAVMANAAELTVRPERLAGMVASAGPVEVAYAAPLDGALFTRISGSFDTAGRETPPDPASGAEIPAGSFTLFLDDYYRPVRIEVLGLNQGISSRITAVNSQWGTVPAP